ncbi:hypothetical protein Pla110_10450 [Polystyrenella longa]|uniref:DUF2062 domain-containing protein n=1 Tax=Polystyrenella longa TaxID=2528007 RepID=A0A518CJF2_9PLAN|nr:TIGR03546 family protein [Polystyrenella longa]QDU79337.1 hypothetical protein Pla110_10450 [Polystyrenella longa]
MRLLLSPVRFLVETLTEASNTSQMAWGFTLGMWIGLVPKDNLLAIGLMTLLYMLRVNLSAALMSAFIFSWVGFLLDPLSHRLGEFLLHLPVLESTWTFLYNQPFVPWTNFNNTVVLGSFVVGAIALYPTARYSRPFFEWFTPRCKERLERFRIVRLIQGAEIAASLGEV